MAVASLGDLGMLAVRYEEALKACDARRGGVVEIVDAANAENRPKPWWKIW